MRNLSEFALFDLCSQHEAVSRYVREWTPVDILEWMSHFGKIVWSEQYLEFIHYPHVSNERSAFYFAENNQLYSFRIRPLLTNNEHRFLNAERNQEILNVWRSISWRGWEYCDSKNWLGYF
jgi:hypothetical protein